MVGNKRFTEEGLALAGFILEHYTGNHTTIYPLVTDEVKRLEGLGVWDEMDTAFLGEFLFFEDDYAHIYKQIGDEHVYDVGCQLGFGSLFFNTYTGIDKYLNPNEWFHSQLPGINYIQEDALTMQEELQHKTIIANMVAGFFSKEEQDPDWINIIKQSKSFSGRVHTRIYEQLDSRYITQLKTYNPKSGLEFISPLFTYQED